MSIAETYVALAIGFLDPDSLPPTVIFHHDNKQWCRDTRCLIIARALEQKHYHQVLEAMQVIDVEKTDKRYEKQYINLIYERIPAMKRKKLDGKTVEVSTRKGSVCCFDLVSDRFRDDVISHVAKDHLNMKVAQLRDLNSYYCEKCKETTQLQLTRFGSKKQRKFYRIMRQCQCNDQGHTIGIPWQQVTFRIMSSELRKYKTKPSVISAPTEQTDDETDDSSSYNNATSFYTDTD